MNATDIAEIEPITHDEAMRLQAEELARAIALLESLEPGDWTARTDCPDWDVRQMYLHVLGACQGGASLRENVHQLRAARARRKRDGGPLEAALSAVQVDERSALGPGQVVTELKAATPKTIRGRRRVPGFARAIVKIPVDGPVNEKWKLGYLVDTIYLRDLWMHRIDASRATGRAPELTAEHDGRIVADVVAEWARRHGRPFRLDLTGPAGRTYVQESDSSEREDLALDAVEFCRTLAGREPATGLLATAVPF